MDGHDLDSIKMVLDVAYQCLQCNINDRASMVASFVVSKVLSQFLVFFKESIIHTSSLPRPFFIHLKCVSFTNEDTSLQPSPPILRFTPIIALYIVRTSMVLGVPFTQMNRGRVSCDQPL